MKLKKSFFNNQIHISKDKTTFSEASFTKPQSLMHVKPMGGLWTSTYHKKIGCGWLAWCQGEDFRLDHEEVYKLKFDPESKVYVIDSWEDYMDLKSQYLVHPPDGATEQEKSFHELFQFIDWVKVSDIYDAIHLTEKGEGETRYPSFGLGSSSRDMGLYGWDCESTLWLKYKVISSEYLGRVSDIFPFYKDIAERFKRAEESRLKFNEEFYKRIPKISKDE